MKMEIVVLISAALLISGLKLAEVHAQDSGVPYRYADFLRGRDGRDGQDGLDGSPGPRGPPGREGKIGERGETGFQGPPGEKGESGLQGPPGEKGEVGYPGPRGDPGFDGIVGRRGPQGSPGISGETGPPGPRGPGGAVYTRWGKTTCASTEGTELVYAGRVGGSVFSQRGGGSNHLCLPDDPDYSSYTPGVQGDSPIHGIEYETVNRGPLSSFHDQNAPCAVCSTSVRAQVLMIPAKTQCPSSWTREYFGYLMAAFKTEHNTMFECVDGNPDTVPGHAANRNGGTFYHTEATCIGLACPPYDPEKELTCVVCTK